MSHLYVDSIPDMKQPTPRKRQVQACSECLCSDRVFPCRPCKSRGDDAICREVEKHDESTTGCASSTSLELLTNRVLHLEAALRSMHQRLPQDLQAGLMPASLSLAHERATSSNPVKPEGPSRRGRPPKKKLAPQNTQEQEKETTGSAQSRPPLSSAVSNDSDEEEAAMILEDFAFGRREKPSFPNDRLKLNSSASSPVDSPQTSYNYPGNVPSASTSTLPRIGPLKASNSFTPPDFKLMRCETSAEDYLKSILAVLPDIKKGKALVKLYVTKVDFFHKAMHVPTFLNDLDIFFRQLNSNSTKEHDEIPPAFTGLYLIVICVALHFADTEEAIAAGFTQEEHKTLPSLYFAASRACLWASDYLENHNLKNLQTIILMGLYLNNTNGSSTHYSLLGAAIKIAQNLGLSRLGGENHALDDVKNSRKSQRSGMWASVVTREVGRRIWWNLVMLDWFLAGPHNYNYSIHPSQNKCCLPSNIDDDDLIDGQPLVAKPMSVYTSMTYQLTRLRSLEHVRAIVDEYNENGHLSLEFTLIQDKKCKDLINDLPEFYKMNYDVKQLGLSPERMQILQWERTLINLSTHTRLVKLHRPILSKGYRNKNYLQSRITCITAARECLAVLRHGDSVGFLERWWICVYYAFASAIVIFIDLIHDDPMSSDAFDKREEIKSALNMLKDASGFSSGADSSAALLEGLLAEEIRQKPDLKRKFGADDRDRGSRQRSGDLSILVKKLLDEGQAAKISSPGSSHHSTPQYQSEQPTNLATYAVANDQKVENGKNSQHPGFTDDLLKRVFEEGDAGLFGLPLNTNYSQQPFNVNMSDLNTNYMPQTTQANDMFTGGDMQFNIDQLFDAGDNNNTWNVLGGNSLSYL
ncbi:hypothetical protein E3Q22_02212 [Wallemia mellicola]|uniref:Xylanolytic transcriptional activator regulatory domain-containing protein n=1 Tax=Wallemia mellicola TaxID=1708541 RepID=A0A4T0MB00_9BASI|nr:hypothetical protein E3Q22_02212 [Wallemia mellicola]